MIFHFAHDKFWNPTLRGWSPVLQPDKWIHLLESAFLFSVFYFLPYHWNALGLMAGLFGQRLVAWLCAWSIMFGYEVYQGFTDVGFSWRDLLADTLGIFALWIIAV